MKIKVLFLIHDLGGGGAEKVLVNLVNHMDYSRYDITVIALFGGGVNEKFLNKSVRFRAVWKHSIPGNSRLMKIMTPTQLHKLCVKDKYDIEISFLEGPSNRIISGCPDLSVGLIGWIHGMQRSKKGLSASFRSVVETERCYKRFDKIVCVSETVLESFISLIPTYNQTSVLYNTFDTYRIKFLAGENIDDVQFIDNEIKIIAVGKITKNKGFDRLAVILKKLLNKGFPVHIYILGEGEMRMEIENYIKRNNLSEHYTFLGYKTNPYKYIAACDLFVCSSWSEGFSTAATEALIVGTPVCSVEVSGMRELLGDEEWGVITKNDNKELYMGIKKLISNASLLRHYKKKAIERGKSFSTYNSVSAVQNMIEEVYLSKKLERNY